MNSDKTAMSRCAKLHTFDAFFSAKVKMEFDARSCFANRINFGSQKSSIVGEHKKTGLWFAFRGGTGKFGTEQRSGVIHLYSINRKYN